MSNKNLLKFEKITEENVRLIGGLFKAHDTYGLPLEISTFILSEKGMLPDFFGFYQDALAAGWPDERAAITVGAAIRDVLGEEMAQGWFKRLERHKAMLQGARIAGPQIS